MGNSLPFNNGVQSSQIRLGESATIHFIKREKFHGNGKSTRSWQISYAVGKLKCKYFLTDTTKYTSSSHIDSNIAIKIVDDVYGLVPEDHCFYVTVEKAEQGLVRTQFNQCLQLSHRHAALHYFRAANTNNAVAGGITITDVYVYGRRTRKSLMVFEQKKKSEDDEKAYMVNLAHYYVNDEDGEGVGLSVVVKKIRVSDSGFLDFDMEGPEQHPVSALLHMFDEVVRTKTWKPTHCPHCANLAKATKRQAKNKDGGIDNAPKASSRGLLGNDGSMFRGHHNGNLNIQRLIIGNPLK